MGDVLARIAALDERLATAAERWRGYQRTGPGTSVVVQLGVLHRLLDERLALMRERDR